MSKIKPLAFYLPQYHPIPENNEWWEEGFTEWTNVTKAKPLYNGHEQPILPADLGFYDLRVEETREHQAKLAKEYGLYGFIYYHYWFGDDKMVLERIAEEVLSSEKPDFPFCFCWANETWSGIWHGLQNQILVEQKYLGKEDIKKHFEYLLPFFQDDRYIKVEGKPVLFIYEPLNIPNSQEYLSQYRQFAKDAGFPDLFIISSSKGVDELDYVALGYDSNVSNSYHQAFDREKAEFLKFSLLDRAIGRLFPGYLMNKGPILIDNIKVNSNIVFRDTNVETYPMVVPNWDNTARSNKRGVVMQNSSPKLFEQEVQKAVGFLSNKSEDHHKFLIIKSWNEWAEGNILEPDRKFGHGYLQALRNCLEEENKKR